MVTLEKLAWVIKHGERALRPSRRSGPANLLMRFKAAEVVYEPLGVVAALVSWNYPFHNMVGPIIAALFTGNAIVVKCSENVVWSSRQYLEIVRSALRACGAPPDLVQLVCCWPEDADHVSAHPGLAHLTFIGSKPVAHRVLAAAARSLTPVVVELGGKDAVVVLDEHRPAWTERSAGDLAAMLMRGSFQSSGQNCIGIERIVAEPAAYGALVAVFEKLVPQLRVGSPVDGDVDMGAMISDARFAALEALIADAVAGGARLLAGGRRYAHPRYPFGAFFEPTLLVDVTPAMRIANEELFAPVMVVMRARDTTDAIAIANSTGYGLGGAVFGSGRRSPAIDRVVRELRTGNVAVNDFATFYVCQLPFGGVRESGYGKFSGEEGLVGLCNAKSVCYDKYPLVHTSLPATIRYPLPSVNKALTLITAMNTAGYASSLWEFVVNLGTLAANAQ
ncbi:Aldehyde/histidinol dehydrogenase [Dipodascopsis tothii]|uniref:Aldehyde/histidinol dehydrogenase n=1 Tax=Dipodascopsis tothii TaxID=44089 RepID=UPI0034CD1F6A